MPPSEREELDRLERMIPRCRRCPRLVAHREEVARVKRRAYRDQEYWGRPVPGFGDPHARLLIIGLAPGAHGANRTGRAFTGDRSGLWLYRALHRAGLSTSAEAVSRDDGLRLRGCFISMVVRCVPPGNRPLPDEIENCREYLERELALLPHVRSVLALGAIAFRRSLALIERAHDVRLRPRPRFIHGGVWKLEGPLPRLVASYHPSQQNTQTGRLTEAMLDDAIGKAAQGLGIGR